MSVEEQLTAYRGACRGNEDSDLLATAASELLEVGRNALPDDRARLVSELAADVRAEAPAWVTSALIAGALVEHGAGVNEIAAALLPKLGPWIERCALDLQERLAHTGELAEDGEASLGEELLGNPERVAWRRLHELHSTAVALLGADVEWRRQLAPLLPALMELEPFHEGAAWLRRILSVPDEEALTVVHVPERRAFRCSMSGIARNFDLFVLLGDALTGDPAEGWLDWPAPKAELVACLAGEGAGEVDETYECPFNAYTWAALSADHALPEPEDFSAASFWVWGEGEPSEIPILDGERILLLGPPSLARVIGVERTFPTLVARLVATPMSSAETVALLDRVASATAEAP